MSLQGDQRCCTRTSRESLTPGQPRRSNFDDAGVGTGRGDRRRARSAWRLGLAVDQLLELLARLEVRHLLRRNVHLVPGFGIPPLARLAPPQPEAAEPAQLDLFAAMERVD